MRHSLSTISFLTMLGLGTSATNIHLSSIQDWDELRGLCSAVRNSGTCISAATEWNAALGGLHGDEMRKQYREPLVKVLNTLKTAEDGLLDSHAGLVMAWGDGSKAEAGKEIIAAWDLNFPINDMTGKCITLTAFPRYDMSSISFSLKDKYGKMKGWRWPVGGPHGLPPMKATTLAVAADGGAGQAGSTEYWDGGINLKYVVSFEFDESGIAQETVLLPDGITGKFFGQWNYWRDIIVFLCPPTKPEHFTCYPVKGLSASPVKKVHLKDQFTSQTVELGMAREICAPAQKNKEEVSNTWDHEVCYEVFGGRHVNVDNQFGVQSMVVSTNLKRLCVPSSKKLMEDSMKDEKAFP